MKNLIRGIAVLLTAVFLCFNIYYELAPGITVAPEQKFVFAAIFAVLLRAALFCGVPDNTRPIRRRLYMLALFLYYIWVLLNVLFFDNAFGRGFGHTSLDMVNLEPLRTVKNYLLAYGCRSTPAPARAMWMISFSIWQVRCLCSLSAGLHRCGTGFAALIQDPKNNGELRMENGE